MAASLNIKLTPSGDRGPHNVAILVVDEIADTESYAFHNQSGLWNVRVFDLGVVDKLMSARAGELEQYFTTIVFDDYDLGLEEQPLVSVKLWPSDGEREQGFLFHTQAEPDNLARREVQLHLQPDIENWARPYSIAEYAVAFEKSVKELSIPGVVYYEEDEIITNGFGIHCTMCGNDPIIKAEIDRSTEILKRALEISENSLATTARKNAVTTFFRFPPTVQNACEQYLIYFVQFLEDLGIKANVEIKEDARRVLFSVTPADGPSALQAIREALEVYLRLPNTAGFRASATQYPDLAVQQLHANVLHLESQLMLSKASFQAQAATIEALQVSNFQYRQLISSQDRLKSQTEPLIGDTIHVTKIEAKGLSVDLPLILKRLKRVLGKVTSNDQEPHLLTDNTSKPKSEER
jgi:hypothetical protein